MTKLVTIENQTYFDRGVEGLPIIPVNRLAGMYVQAIKNELTGADLQALAQEGRTFTGITRENLGWAPEETKVLNSYQTGLVVGKLVGIDDPQKRAAFNRVVIKSNEILFLQKLSQNQYE